MSESGESGYVKLLNKGLHITDYKPTEEDIARYHEAFGTNPEDKSYHPPFKKGDSKHTCCLREMVSRMWFHYRAGYGQLNMFRDFRFGDDLVNECETLLFNAMCDTITSTKSPYIPEDARDGPQEEQKKETEEEES